MGDNRWARKAKWKPTSTYIKEATTANIPKPENDLKMED